MHHDVQSFSQITDYCRQPMSLSSSRSASDFDCLNCLHGLITSDFVYSDNESTESGSVVLDTVRLRANGGNQKDTRKGYINLSAKYSLFS